MEKINVAELLKDCPKGMELYSTIYGTVYFKGVRDTGNAVLIDVTTFCNTEVFFYPDGKFNTYYSDSEMTLFPSKDVRTWEGFVPPCQFKEGDIVFVGCGDIHKYIAIFKQTTLNDTVRVYSLYDIQDDRFYIHENLCEASKAEIRLATEEEKEKLFKIIKNNGYKWNETTKTLEKLNEPKFKVGDTITNGKTSITIGYIDDEYYYEISRNIATRLFIKNQDKWNLVPNKFDITTLKPFDKVLYRMHDKDTWCNSFYCFYKSNHYFVTSLAIVKQCIPYEGNEYLLGTTDDCNEYFKTWE